MVRFCSSKRSILALCLLLLIAAPLAAREHIPAPPGGGPGLTAYPADNGPLPAITGPAQQAIPTPATPAAICDVPSAKADVGGEDYVIRTGDLWYEMMDVAPNGDIYVVQNEKSGTVFQEINVWRSVDAGATFQLWGHLSGSDTMYWADDMMIVDGAEPVFLMAYRYDDGDTNTQIRVVSCPLGSTADFSGQVVVMGDPDVRFHSAAFDTDVSTFEDFYVYVVASGHLSPGQDIWFARSIDQGASFETPYMIAELTVADRYYVSPDISYGYGGHLHAVWSLNYDDDSGHDSSLRYRHASAFGGGGLSSWDYWITMTSALDGVDDGYPVIHGGRQSHDVFIAYSRWVIPGSFTAAYFVSDDDGSTFGSPTAFGIGIRRLGALVEDTDSGLWTLGLNVGTDYGYSTAHVSDLTDWSSPLFFNDEPCQSGAESDLALDPTHGNQPVMLWCDPDGTDDTLYLDAAWRGDPGWPRQEPGFPLGIWAPPVSPPALVDVDGDPELEIVFADELRQIQVLNPDGSSATGWPVDVGIDLSDGPVAVGDLNGDGHPILAVGGTDGKAYAYDHLGNLLPGWPSAITAGAESIYVAIGAVGPPYQRSVVCAGGTYVTIRNRRGVAPPGAVGWSTPGATYVAPPAIGDIDDDGRAEIVCGPSPRVLAFEMGVHTLEFDVTLPYALSDALTLGDLDQDGDLEIVCPTTGGILYVLDHTGAQVGGNFPFDTGDTGPLTSAALAKMSGSDGPELVFAHRDYKVYGLHDDGTLLPGYPVNSSTAWYLWGAPIIGRVAGGANVTIGDRGDLVWTWTNGGTVVEGWPRQVNSQVNVSPAMGDIDLDGSNEIVVLTDAQVHVLDVGVPPQGADYTWPMYGHDPQRTGCADCPEDIVTPVGDEGALTRVSFAGASPNPVSGATRFAFAVPAHAAANLEIIDLRGRRLCTVFREEIDAGPQVVAWNGRDARGRPLASGQYFARLRVSGPNLDDTLIRKLVILR